jgi:hypothetical protein
VDLCLILTWNQCDRFLTWQANFLLGEAFGAEAADHDTSFMFSAQRPESKQAWLERSAEGSAKGATVIDRVLRIFIGACMCVAFFFFAGPVKIT